MAASSLLFSCVRVGTFKRGLALCGKSLLLLPLAPVLRGPSSYSSFPLLRRRYFSPLTIKRDEGLVASRVFCRLEISVSLRIECVFSSRRKKKKTCFSPLKKKVKKKARFYIWSFKNYCLQVDSLCER